ncbi:hypothetical protein CHF27_001955 [Romboutsia maritimum]|uniref:Uncharacterized protein n=1 Tax=Romboutsia maritimum TaxID=2020948 RepID=A0A371IWY6_9FIRM|nr:hypothetical protein [Romboutsia maritimum]RDY24988.1 hypothetical protein CHF27_001955 [Romboutsia maritimum]
MKNYNYQTNSKDCCCSCGLKKAICILTSLNSLIDTNEKITIYYSNTSPITNASILNSHYPSLVLINGTNNSNNTVESYICVDCINAIKVYPKNNDYQSIINILNGEYNSPICLTLPCIENCCCKYSIAGYLKDKYITMSNRNFNVSLCNSPHDILNVSVIHLDYDVAWLLNSIDKVLYLVQLCNICSLSEVSV